MYYVRYRNILRETATALVDRPDDTFQYRRAVRLLKKPASCGNSRAGTRNPSATSLKKRWTRPVKLWGNPGRRLLGRSHRLLMVGVAAASLVTPGIPLVVLRGRPCYANRLSHPDCIPSRLPDFPAVMMLNT
jgi:hypothetical protein